jgi:hypothetical protein
MHRRRQNSERAHRDSSTVFSLEISVLLQLFWEFYFTRGLLFF